MSAAASGIVSLPEGGVMRLDRYIAVKGILTRSQLKARNATAIVNGLPKKFSFIVKNLDRFSIVWEDIVYNNIQSEDIYLNILFENERVIVVNKAQGMVTHPAAGNWSGTLVNALLGRAARCGAAAGDGFSPLRPYIVHRLDKDTSGVIIAAWDAAALELLQAQFRTRTVRKRYLALVRGMLRDNAGVIDAPLGRDPRDRKRFTVVERGKPALTRYRVLRRFTPASGGSYALLSLAPKTGRTHQLRAHLKHIGCPIVGDGIYGVRDRQFPRATLMLHARRLAITLPGESVSSTFSAPLPEHFTALLKSLL